MDPAAVAHLPAKRTSDDHPTRTDPTPPKKSRSVETKKVAEIILLLSAMAEMRGGRSPTLPELDLMAEARAKLVEVCQSTLKPKDMVSKEAIEALIDDLGLLKKNKEQSIITAPPKLSIADKLLHTKKKMEEEAKQLKAKLARMAAAAPSIGNVHGSVSGSSVYQMNLNNGNTRPIGGALNNAGRTSSFTLPGAVKPHYGGPRPVLVGSSLDHSQKNTSTWSVQPQTLSFSRYGNDKVSMTSRNDESASRVITQSTRDQPPRTFGSHIPNHQSLQETASGQGALLVNNHSEVSKTVQKLLQKQVLERPTWTPPSRDYMNKAVMCQVCHNTVNDVESVFLCDACEHAYHFRCLPSSNQKVVPRGEWHCPKCLQQSNGKPLPPKYGRVTRNVTATKVPSKVAGFQNSSDQKANMQKARAVNLHSVITGSVASSTRLTERREVQGTTSAKSYSEANFVKNTNQSGVNGEPLGGSADFNAAQDVRASSLQGQSMIDTNPRPVVKLTGTVQNVSEREHASSGLSTGEHTAKFCDVPNMHRGSSSINDLIMPDPVAKLSDPGITHGSNSPQSSKIVLKHVSRLTESDTHNLDLNPAKLASAPQLTNDPTKISSATQLVNVVTADYDPDLNNVSSKKVDTDREKIASAAQLTSYHELAENELSSHKAETVTPVPGANTSGQVDDISRPSQDQLE